MVRTTTAGPPGKPASPARMLARPMSNSAAFQDGGAVGPCALKPGRAGSATLPSCTLRRAREAPGAISGAAAAAKSALAPGSRARGCRAVSLAVQPGALRPSDLVAVGPPVPGRDSTAEARAKPDVERRAGEKEIKGTAVRVVGRGESDLRPPLHSSPPPQSPTPSGSVSCATTTSDAGTPSSLCAASLRDFGVRPSPPRLSSPESSPCVVELSAADCSSSGSGDSNGDSSECNSIGFREAAFSTATAFTSKAGQSSSAARRLWQAPARCRWSRDANARQARLLLASLLENIISLYDQSPERNRQLYHLLCGRLTRLGLLQDEHIDEMSSLRTAYNRGFRELVSRTVYEAAQLERPTISSLTLQATDPPSDSADGRASATISASASSISHNRSQSVSLVPCRQPLRRSCTSPLSVGNRSYSQRRAIGSSLTLRIPDVREPAFHSAKAVAGEIGPSATLFDFTESRYASDFQEIGYLGKGGYGDVVAARNRLDGAVYAIKKINVGRFGNRENVNYQKLFREIKSLARLEHVNIVRYHSSWIEHAPLAGSLTRPCGWARRHSVLCHSQSDVGTRKGDISGVELTGRRKSFPHLRPVGATMSKRHELRTNVDDEEEQVARLGIEEPPCPSGSSPHTTKSRPSAAFSGSKRERRQPSSPPGSSAALFDEGSNSLTSSAGEIYQFEDDAGGFGDLILFIQMQLYEANLRDWIRCRNRLVFKCLDRAKATFALGATLEGKCYCRKLRRSSQGDAGAIVDELRTDVLAHVDKFAAMDMFCGLSSGVHYLHSKGHIHRDLKPANVFLERADTIGSGSTPSSPAIPPTAVCDGYRNRRMQKEALLTQNRWIPKIGDFGLATTTSRNVAPDDHDAVQHNQMRSPLSPSRTVLVSQDAPPERTKHVGTITYASPEMLCGLEYDEKVDIWSLGIILFELLHPFATEMERARMLENLRSRGEIPEDFKRRFPSEAALILRLTAANPAGRPTSKEVLNLCKAWLRTNRAEPPEIAPFGAAPLPVSSRHGYGPRPGTPSPLHQEVLAAVPSHAFRAGLELRRSPYTDLPLPPRSPHLERRSLTPGARPACPAECNCACHRLGLDPRESAASLRKQLDAKDAELAAAAEIRRSLENRVCELQEALAKATRGSGTGQA